MPLRSPQTTFVGRAHELAVLAELHVRRAPLVTFLGPGGIGKTRLALQHAASLPLAIVCDASAALTQAGLFEAMCATLDVTLGPRSSLDDALDKLGHALAARGELVVVLDNVEQLAEVVAPILTRWRALAPATRFLVTSRNRLRLAGETVLDIGPLAMPTDAVALFHDRVHAARAGWQPDEVDEHAILGIVGRLDGFPLAIELAATRCRVLSVQELAARLEDGLAVLDRNTRDAAPRHETMVRAIEWSVAALGPGERDALAQCSVFRGGFTLKAAEAVLEVSAAATVLDLLQALSDRSLITADPAGRFTIYASIRELGQVLLRASPDVERATAARHAGYYVALAESIVGSGTLQRHALELERENLVAAHQTAARTGTAELLARAALVIDDVLAWRGPLQENLALLDAAIAGDRATAISARLLARVLEARGRSLDGSGRTSEARRDLERALAIAATEHDRTTEARARSALCVIARKQRRFDDAIDHGERALALCRELGLRRSEAFALGALGAIALERGEHASALATMQRLHTLAEADGDQWLEAMTGAHIGHVHHETLELAQAAQAFDRAIATFVAMGDRRHAAVFGVYRAMVDHEQGLLREARDGYLGRIADLHTLGVPRFEGLARACLGAAAAQLGLRDEARTQFAIAGHHLEQAGDPALVLALELHRLHLIDDAQRADAMRRGLVTDNPLVQESDDVRFAMRTLARTIAATATVEGHAELIVASDGRWFRIAGETVSLQRSGSLRRLVLALTDTRLRAPGSALGWQALLAAGWPGERVIPAAGAHRVQVAIATLRRRGLRDVLGRRDDGYLLDPRIRVGFDAHATFDDV